MPGSADRASARAVLDLDAPQLKGVTTITARPAVAAIHGIDLVSAPAQRDRRSKSKLSSGRAARCWSLLGLDRTVAAGDGPAQFEGSGDGRVGQRRCG